ncbi:hypothetical protein L0F63_001312 [Massospora cicadina]|nr:hypothetical protein L0F63_001312 [Massospora cicadina]
MGDPMRRKGSTPNSALNAHPSPPNKPNPDGWIPILQGLKFDAAHPKKRCKPHTSTEGWVARLDRLVSNYGLPNEAIEAYVAPSPLTVVCLEAKVVRQVVLLLIPRQAVPETVLFTILGSLASDTNRYALRLLLRWVAALLQMGHLIESTARLQRAYTILFHYLIYDQLRPHVAHILYPHHPPPPRPTLSLSLQARFPGDVSLAGLMAFYKQVCPGRVILGRGLLRPARSVATKLWMRWNGRTRELDVTRRLGLRLGPSDTGSGFRRRKEVDLCLPTGIATAPEHGKVALYLLPTWDELLSSVDVLAPPDRSAAYLGDRHLQLYMMSSNIEDGAEAWLTHALRDATLWTDQSLSNSRALNRLLNSVLSCTRRTRRLPLGVKNVLSSYLVTWDGVTHQSLLFELIAYYPPVAFRELDRSAPAALTPRPLRLLPAVLGSGARRLCPPLTAVDASRTAYRAFYWKVHRARAQLGELLADLYPAYSGLVTVFPIELLNRLFMNVFGGMTLSRVCGALAQFARSFQPCLESSCGAVGVPPSQQTRFADMVLDVCDALWRLNAFIPQKDASTLRLPFGLPCTFDAALEGQLMLSLTVHPGFAILAHPFLTRKDGALGEKLSMVPLTPFCFSDHVGGRKASKVGCPASLTMLGAYAAFRGLFLDHLDELGFKGLRAFFKTFVTASPSAEPAEF